MPVLLTLFKGIWSCTAGHSITPTCMFLYNALEENLFGQEFSLSGYHAMATMNVKNDDIHTHKQINNNILVRHVRGYFTVFSPSVFAVWLLHVLISNELREHLHIMLVSKEYLRPINEMCTRYPPLLYLTIARFQASASIFFSIRERILPGKNKPLI